MAVVLEEDGDRAPEIAQSQGANVVPTHKDGPFVGVVEAHDEFEDCALSGTIGPDDDLRGVVRESSERLEREAVHRAARGVARTRRL